MWKDILKNIQITSQKGKTKDIRLPPKEKDEEDCYKFFYDLVKILDPSFELPYIVYNDESRQPTNYWCWLLDEPLSYKEMMAGGNSYLLKGIRTSPIQGLHVQIAYEQRSPYKEYDGKPDRMWMSIGSRHYFVHKYREGRLLSLNERMAPQEKLEERFEEIKKYLGV